MASAAQIVKAVNSNASFKQSGVNITTDHWRASPQGTAKKRQPMAIGVYKNTPIVLAIALVAYQNSHMCSEVADAIEKNWRKVSSDADSCIRPIGLWHGGFEVKAPNNHTRNIQTVNGSTIIQFELITDTLDLEDGGPVVTANGQQWIYHYSDWFLKKMPETLCNSVGFEHDLAEVFALQIE